MADHDSERTEPPSPRATAPRRRRAPTQARGRQRIADILEATALLVDELGPDNVTTTTISERLDISVGSIYTYFEDRSAIFDEIVSRSISAHDVLTSGIRAVRGGEETGGEPDRWFEKSFLAIDTLARAYRSEPGFRTLWFSQHLSSRMLESMRASDEMQARRLVAGLAQEGLRLECPNPLNAMRMYVGLVDKGLDLAFRNNPRGNSQMIEETKQVVRRYLGAYLVPAAPDSEDDAEPQHLPADNRFDQARRESRDIAPTQPETGPQPITPPPEKRHRR